MSSYTTKGPDDAVIATYNGMSPFMTPEQVEGRLVVIAWFDGEPDLWVADDEKGIEEIRRYYRDEGWSDDRVLIQILKEGK